MLRPLADDLATAGPDRRAGLVANALRVGLPQTLAILADLLVDRLGSRSARARNGAAEALVGLGPAALGALKRAARTARGIVRVEGLATVLVRVGAGLSDRERADLLMHLAVAHVFHRDPGARAALTAAAIALRPDEPAGEEVAVPPVPPPAPRRRSRQRSR